MNVHPADSKQREGLVDGGESFGVLVAKALRRVPQREAVETRATSSTEPFG
jgi:hypothetical protein